MCCDVRQRQYFGGAAAAARAPYRAGPGSSVWERSRMNYLVFRSAVQELLEEEKEWDVHTDWEDVIEEDQPEDFIELEQEKGAFYEFMTISMNRLFVSYQEEGWDAVVRELDRYTHREGHRTARKRGIDYEARLDEEGAALYRQLRELRSGIAAEKRVPPYIIFMNRALYEMAAFMPDSMEELRRVYGVGEKNSKEYGEAFLEQIRLFKENKNRNCIPEYKYSLQ